jgi:DNA-binding NarL/FixJ family response regulator
MNIKVLLVDDHKIMRDGLIALMDDEADIDVVAQAGTGAEAVEKAMEHQPDVVVMDLTLPDMGGIEVTRRIMKLNPRIRVLVLSMLMDKYCVLESLESGARGYLAKDCAAEELVAAIRTVHDGSPYLCASAQEIILQSFTSSSVAERTKPALTKREMDVLKLTAQGFSTKEIAFSLGVSIKMIEIHRMNLRKKLGLKSIAQLTTYALRIGLISIK